MAGRADSDEVQRLESLSIDRRRLIGQAIIDGLVSPAEAAMINFAADPDYDQGQGNYTQKGGDHRQAGGDYNQSAVMMRERFEPLFGEVRVIRE